jgi:hypothetical protein
MENKMDSSRFPAWLGLVLLIALLGVSVYFSSLKPSEVSIGASNPVATAFPTKYVQQADAASADGQSTGEESFVSPVTLGALNVEVRQSVTRTASSQFETISFSDNVPVGSVLVVFVDKGLASSASQIQSEQNFEVVQEDPIIKFKVSKSQGNEYALVLPTKSDKSTVVLLLDSSWDGKTDLLKALSELGSKQDRNLFRTIDGLLNRKDANGQIDFQTNLDAALSALNSVPQSTGGSASLADEILIEAPTDGDFNEQFTFTVDELLSENTLKLVGSKAVLDAKFANQGEFGEAATLSFEGDAVTITFDKAGLALDSVDSDAGLVGKLDLLFATGNSDENPNYYTSKTIRLVPVPPTVRPVSLQSHASEQDKTALIEEVIANAPSGTTIYEIRPDSTLDVLPEYLDSEELSLDPEETETASLDDAYFDDSNMLSIGAAFFASMTEVAKVDGGIDYLDSYLEGSSDTIRLTVVKPDQVSLENQDSATTVSSENAAHVVFEQVSTIESDSIWNPDEVV